MGNKTQTSSTQTQPNTTALNAYNALIANTGKLETTPYNPYTGPGVAPINPEQTQGINNINAYANAAQPAIGNAIGLVQGAANPLTAAQIGNYYSPFQQNVVNTTEQAFNNQNAQQQQQVLGNDVAQGALGGNRTAVGHSILAGQQQAQEAPVLAGLENTGYNQAVQYAMQQYQQNPENAAYALGNLGVAGENAGLTGANAQIGAGSLQQQTQQAQDVFNYQQYLNQNAYPFQLNQYAAGIDTGVGSNMGGYSTSTYPGPSWLGQIAGLGLAGAGLYKSGIFGKDGGRVEGLATGGTPYGGANDYLPGNQVTHGRGPPAPPGMPQQQSAQQMIQGASALAKGFGGLGLGKTSLGDSISDFTQDLGDAAGGRVMAYGGLALPTQNRINVSASHDHFGHPVRAGLGMPSFMGRKGFADGGGDDSDFDSRFTGDVPQSLAMQSALQPLGTPVAGVSAPATPPPDAIQNAQEATPAPVQVAANATPGVASDALPPEITSGRSLPRGLRNNNPGNIENGSFASSQPGYAGSDGRFARFETPQAGRNAASNLLASYADRGINTINGIVSRWAPSSDHNDVGAYAGFVASKLGVSPNQPLDVQNPQVRQSVAEAMAQFENGTGATPGADHVLAFSGEPGTAGLQRSSDSTSDSTPPKPKGVSSDAWQSLLAAGLGMMASQSPFPGVAIGQGGLTGLAQFNALHKEELAEKAQHDTADYRAKALEETSNYHRAEIGRMAQQDRLAQEREELAQKRYEVPQGYQRGPNGSLAPIQGGPQDPATIQAQSKAKLAAGFSEEAIDIAARRDLAGDAGGLTQIARGTSGPANLAAVRNREAAILQDEQGLSAQQAAEHIARKSQEYKATGVGLSAEARTAGNREANLNIILRATDAAIPAALDASEKVGRTGWVPINQIIQKGEVIASNPDLKAFGMANLQLAEHWARAMNPTGVMRESDRDKALSFLSTADSPDTYKRAVMQLRTQITRERDAVSGQKPVEPGGAAPSEQQGTATTPKEGERKQFKQGWGVYRGGKWVPE